MGWSVAFLARVALHGVLGGQLPMFFFVINCLAIAFFLGFGPSMAALIASIPVAWISFVPPAFELTTIDRADIVTAAGFFLITALAAGLIEWLRRSLYCAELHARVSDSRYRMLVDIDQDRRHAATSVPSGLQPLVMDDAQSHAIIFLHGLQGSSAELGSLPRAFERIGYTVSTLEIDGYSAQGGSNGAAGSWERWCDAVQDEVTRLAASHRTVSICGLSMGATLALAAAARGAEVQAVVALSPVLRYDGWAISRWSGLMVLPYALGWRDWVYSEREPYGLKNLEMRRRVSRSLQDGAGVSAVGANEISARHLHAAKLLMAFVRSRLSLVKAPVAVIHAVDDETAAPRNAECVLARVGSNMRKALWLGDSYHIITLDNEREVVANDVVRFVCAAARGHDGDQERRRSSSMAVLRDRRNRLERQQA
ncbi:MAG: hypothetical protein NVS2B4_00900 [Ramlibacter sp.]